MIEKEITYNGVDLVVREDGSIFRKEFIRSDGKPWPSCELIPTKLKCGYRKIKLNGKQAKVHRVVATAFLNKPEGADFVDHIDGNRSNNEASNLRWVTQGENNRAFRNSWKRGTCEYLGVSWKKSHQRFTAQIRLGKKNHYLGLFEDAKEAAKAYDAKAVELGFPPERLNFAT